MTNEGSESSPRAALRDLFHRRGAEVGDNDSDSDRTLSGIMRMLDANVAADEVLPLIQRLRGNGDGDLSLKLDRYFVRRLGGFDAARRDFESALGDLHGKLQQLLSPPFFPARFLGSVETSEGEYAKVVHDGAYRVVAFGDELSSSDVGAGDEVYLCHERNVAIAKAPTSREEIGETAALVRRINDGRLVLSDRDAEIVVSAGNMLAHETLRAGDIVLWDRAARIALSRLEPGKSVVGYEDVDDTAQQQLGGLDQLREEVLSRFVLSILHPDAARKYQVLNDSSRRLLLIGPPGTGKTTLMRVVASKVSQESQRKCRVVTISGAELYSSYVGETERNIRRCFATLNDYDGPGIAFFDEIDAIGRARGQVSGYHDDRFLGTLLSELEGMRRSDVAVIAATNRADALDSALRSRFAWELEMPRPNMNSARQIFGVHMAEDLPYRPNGVQAPTTRQFIIEAGVSRLFEPNADNMIASLQFRDGKRREVAARELVSGRLIEQVCAAARATAFERSCRGGEAGICVEDMQAAVADAVERLRKTLTIQNAKSYLGDLPQDLDVVSVEPIRPRLDSARYAC